MSAATIPPAQPNLNFDSASYGRRLQEETLACRVRTWKMGTRRALTKDQKHGLAEMHHADVKAISASKRLLDTKHPAYKRVRSILSNARKYWQSVSVPYPDPGVRLIKRSKVTAFTDQMSIYKTSLNDACVDLAQCYGILRDRARQELGDLYDASDYPTNIASEFALDWDFPSIKPPDYLKNVHPELYEQEQQRIQARFSEAVRLAEEAFIGKFHELVGHMADRLRGDVDGKPKVLRASTLGNLKEFFSEFRDLDIGSNEHLSSLVDQAERLVGGQDIEALRENEELRDTIGTSLAEMEQVLSAMTVDAESRQIDLDDDEDPDDDLFADEGDAPNEETPDTGAPA